MSRIRTIITAAAIATVSTILGANSAQAGYTTIQNTPYAGERDIHEILDHVYGGTFSLAGNDFSNGALTATRVDDADDQGWTGVVTSIKALARFAGYGQNFGTVSGGVFSSLLNTSGTGFSITGQLTTPVDLSDKSYSFARTGGGSTVSSTVADNSDGIDHMVTYKLTGSGITEPTYLLFFEDLIGGGDRDYNDLAIQLTMAGAPNIPAVPLPAAALMGIVTLAGGTVFRKRIVKAIS